MKTWEKFSSLGREAGEEKQEIKEEGGVCVCAHRPMGGKNWSRLERYKKEIEAKPKIRVN